VTRRVEVSSIRRVIRLRSHLASLFSSRFYMKIEKLYCRSIDYHCYELESEQIQDSIEIKRFHGV